MQQADENFWRTCKDEVIANLYQLEQLLGCGTFGGVFRAVQIVNGRKQNKRVAVKLMLSGKIQSEELEFAINLPSHQNLVQHFTGNSIEIRGFPMIYLVMELADGSLADLVRKRGKLTSSEVKPIVRDIAQGLNYLHELDFTNSQAQKYVHRDLKLLNILQVGSTWKIADFGLAKTLNKFTMQASKIAGTPYYMPPELFRNGYVSTKWDIWSLGVMIVEMLTGHFPFEAMTQDELERKIQRELPNLQGIPIEWINIVKGCLQKDHGQRWDASRVLTETEKVGLPIQTTQYQKTVPKALYQKTVLKAQPYQQKTSPVRTEPSSTSSNNLFGSFGIALFVCVVAGGMYIRLQNGNFSDTPISASSSTQKTSSAKSIITNPKSLPKSDEGILKVKIGDLESYKYPSGLFQLDVPKGWEPKENKKPNEVIVLWFDPTKNALLSVDVFKNQSEKTPEQLTALLEKFLTQTFGGRAGFATEKPIQQKDGSVQIVWSYDESIKNITTKVQGNSFISRNGDKVSLITTGGVADQIPALKESFDRVVNSYKVDPAVAIP